MFIFLRGILSIIYWPNECFSKIKCVNCVKTVCLLELTRVRYSNRFVGVTYI